MILYHFTGFYHLENVGPENISAVGLKAMPIKDWAPMLLGRSGVWLTANPDMPNTYSSFSEVRIKLKISSSDRRLVYIPKLMRKYAGLIPPLDATSPHWRSFYLYFGDVPLELIIKVEYADPARRASFCTSDHAD
jgi:hypothetical protein